MSFKPIPENVRRAEINAGCEAVRKIYNNWRYEMTRKRPMIGKPVTNIDLRYSLMECVILVHKNVKSAPVRLIAVRGFEEMLKRIGGPIQSPDQAFDEAMREKDEKTGPDEQSIHAAIEELRKHGISFPDGPKGPETPPPAVPDGGRARLSSPESSGSADSSSNN